jgi:CTP synthase (UTP-ammonia lyase)
MVHEEGTMPKVVRIGVIGDFNPRYPSHLATNRAIADAAGALAITADVNWLPTPTLHDAGAVLDGYDGLWASPGSLYQSMDGALAAIRFARERGRPFIGT